jgi:hypothetical protein
MYFSWVGAHFQVAVACRSATSAVYIQHPARLLLSHSGHLHRDFKRFWNRFDAAHTGDLIGRDVESIGRVRAWGVQPARMGLHACLGCQLLPATDAQLQTEIVSRLVFLHDDIFRSVPNDSRIKHSWRSCVPACADCPLISWP